MRAAVFQFFRWKDFSSPLCVTGVCRVKGACGAEKSEMKIRTLKKQQEKNAKMTENLNEIN